MVRKHYRWKRAVATTLALGIAFATASQALARTDTAGPRGDAPAASHYTKRALRALGQRWQAEAAAYQSRSAGPSFARPDDRAGIRAVDGRAVLGTHGRVLGIAPAVGTSVAHASDQVSSSPGSGVDARDLIIGVAIGLGIALVAASLVGLARGTRRTGPSPSV
jgi:hypothetical protein